MLQGEMKELKDERRALERDRSSGLEQDPGQTAEGAWRQLVEDSRRAVRKAEKEGEEQKVDEEEAAEEAPQAAAEAEGAAVSAEVLAEEAEKVIAQAAAKVERKTPAKPGADEIPAEVAAAAQEAAAAAAQEAAARPPMEVPEAVARVKASAIAEGAPMQQRVDLLESRVDELYGELERVMSVVMERTAKLKEAEDTLKSVQIFLANSRKEHVG